MLVMILRFLIRVITCPNFSSLLRNWVNRDAGNKRPAIRPNNRAAGNKGPAVSSLPALMKCVPGFNTAQLRELLLKLQVPAVEEVPGLPVKVLYTMVIVLSYNSITLLYDSVK